jgi:dihydrofolate reductase
VIVSLIAAVSQNGGIGLDGGVPWHLTDDLKNFKRVTMGHHLIVGRVTYESIGRPLPGRTMLVVSRDPDYEAPGCEVVSSLEEALALAEERGEDEAFVAGGAQIYALAMPLAIRMYYTEVRADVEADTFFPEFDAAEWVEVEAVEHAAGEGNDFDFIIKVLEKEKVIG